MNPSQQAHDQVMSQLVSAMGGRSSYNLVYCSFYLIVLKDLAEESTRSVTLDEIRKKEMEYYPDRLLETRVLKKYLGYMKDIDLIQIFQSAGQPRYQLIYSKPISPKSKNVVFYLLRKMHPEKKQKRLNSGHNGNYCSVVMLTKKEDNRARQYRKLFMESEFWNNIYYFLSHLNRRLLPLSAFNGIREEDNKFYRLKRKFNPFMVNTTQAYDGGIIEKTVIILDKIIIPHRR